MTQVQTVKFFVVLIVTGIYGGYKMVYSKKFKFRRKGECKETILNVKNIR